MGLLKKSYISTLILTFFNFFKNITSGTYFRFSDLTVVNLAKNLIFSIFLRKNLKKNGVENESHGSPLPWNFLPLVYFHRRNFGLHPTYIWVFFMILPVPFSPKFSDSLLSWVMVIDRVFFIEFYFLSMYYQIKWKFIFYRDTGKNATITKKCI